MVAGAAQRRGALLVDVLVGVVMLGVALAVMLGLSARAISSQRSGENLQTAAALIDEKLNLVLARGADSYASRFGEMEGSCDEPFNAFRYKIEIGDGASGQPYRVVVTVTWVESGREHEAAVETRIAPRLGDDPDPDRRPAETTQRLGGG